LYLQSWQLFLLALFFIPFSILIVAVFTKPFQKGHRKVMSQAAETESYLIETLNGISTVKALNAEYDAVLETENRFIKMIKSGFKVGLFKNLQFSLQNFITLIGGIVILWVGGYLVIKGQLSIGQLITFNALLVYFFNPIQSLINLQPTLQEAYVAAERLGEILDLDIESENDSKLLKPVSFKGDISFQDVYFRYGTRQTVLENINLKILRGEKIAIVGESGSGKTTLVKLILKYYLPEKGEILIDEQNIKDIQNENLRNKTGYVPQDVFLFSGTIRDNISFGKDNVSFEEIVEACKTVQAHEFINEFPLRYDTIIGERGATLSGGQKQRIALARAFLGNPDILILDEATSNLDSITEKAIHSTVERISNDKTTIVIAHRLSTIMKCDRIIVMDKGKIAEIGSHNDLLHKTGLYRKLWEGQSLSNIKEEMLA
jgi:ABC-type bacteriocin/lantibiotic exporter with double-glycine peptidase domain